MKDRNDWVVELMEETFLPADLRCIIKVQYLWWIWLYNDNNNHDDYHNYDDDDENDDNLDHRLRRSWQLAITSKGFSQQPIHITTSSISHRHCDEDFDDDFDNDDLVQLRNPSLLPVFFTGIVMRMMLLMMILMMIIFSTSNSLHYFQYFPQALWWWWCFWWWLFWWSFWWWW